MSSAWDGKEDVRTPVVVIEVKTRKKLPSWLKTALAQVCAQQPGPERMHLLGLHETGAPQANDLVVMRFAEFEAWHGEIGER